MSILSMDSRSESRKGSRPTGGFWLSVALHDEAAEQAAKRIRFKPAQADGRAVDYRATVHITFRIS
jgi:hypothetical protein